MNRPVDIMPSSNKMNYPDDPSFNSPPSNNGKLEMPQDEIDAVLRNKRKARDPKACYACHRRKVKCDRGLPCDSCVKRDHPELCSYERPGKRRRIALNAPVANANHDNQSDGPDHFPPQAGPNVTVSKEQWNKMNQELQTLRDAVKGAHADIPDETMDRDDADGATVSRSDESEREGIHAPSDQMGTMHLGSRSVLAYMMALRRSKTTQNTARTILEENILPKLGLDNESASYPFVDLWSTDNSMQDVSGLCKALPDDQSCQEFFVAYRDVACTIYPVVADPAQFEANINMLLANRALTGGDEICCSYQALRMANFLTHPSLEAIQAFLIIGNVLSYNMNPGVAYIFLGLTMRMAFSIGLQADSQDFSPAEQYSRSRIWWALAWQDSHFSVSYDRPTASALCCPDIPYRKCSTPGHRSYAESMFRIIRLTQEIIRERTLNPRSTMTWTTIQSYTEEVARIVADASPHVRERKYCKVMTQHLERLALKLHSSYITSELCRPALKDQLSSTNTEDGPHNINATPGHSPVLSSQPRRKSSSHHAHSPISSDPNLPIQLRRDCIVGLEGTIAAYVELHSLSEFAARSWIGIQRAVSAAFLLGTLRETNQDPKIHSLLRNLEQVISHWTIEDPAFETNTDGRISPIMQTRKPSSETPSLAESPHWAKSMTKSLKALGRLNKALQGQPHLQPVLAPANSNLSSMNRGNGFDGSMTAMSVAGGLAMPGYPQVNNLKLEVVSPGGGMGMMTTPDSTSSGDWNYGNITERAKEYVSQPLWG